MKMSSDFRNRVLAGELVGGTFLNLGSPLTVEMAGLSGLDWLLLDHEHGPGSDTTILHQLQAVAATPAKGIVRIAINDPARFKRVLDAGAHGVMIPYINTAAEARLAVSAMRYAPRGIRGVARLNRGCAFGSDFDSYYAHSHEWLVTMCQIESPEAANNIDAIAAVDGVDVLFVGPTDLSANMNILGQYNDPKFKEMLQKIATGARRAGKAAGILALDPSNVAPWKEMGYTVIALGSDGGAVNAAMRGWASLLKK